MGRENPAEHKAQKMARSVTRGLVDRALKPDTEEKRFINEILHYPPNRYSSPCWLFMAQQVCKFPDRPSPGYEHAMAAALRSDRQAENQ